MLENPIKNPLPRTIPVTVAEAYQLLANCSAELATQVGAGDLQAAQTYARMREVYSTIALNSGRGKFDALGVDARHVAWIYRGMRAMQKTPVAELNAVCAWLQGVPVLPAHKTAGAVYVAHFVQFLATQKQLEIPAIHSGPDGPYIKRNGLIHLISQQEIQRLGEEEIFWSQFREQTISIIGGLAATMHGAQRKLPDKIAIGVDFAQEGDSTVYTMHERKEDGSIETHAVNEVARSAARRIAWHLRTGPLELVIGNDEIEQFASAIARTFCRPSETTDEDCYEEGQGAFVLKSERLLVTDPAYGLATNVWTAIENAAPGVWAVRLLFVKGKPAALTAELLGAPHNRGEWTALARGLLVDSDFAVIGDVARFADFTPEQLAEDHSRLQLEIGEKPTLCLEGGYAVRSGSGSFRLSTRSAGERVVGVRIDFLEKPSIAGQDQDTEKEVPMSTKTEQSAPAPSPDPRTLEPRPASPDREGVQTADGTKTGNETFKQNVAEARDAEARDAQAPRHPRELTVEEKTGQPGRTLDEAAAPERR